VGKLKLEKQSVKDLSAGEQKQVKGGVKRQAYLSTKGLDGAVDR
jgi:hypothetical protein